MCWWIFGHCYHKVENSERKMRAKKKKCERCVNPFVCYDKYGTYVRVVIQKECCKCGRRVSYKMKDYDMSRWAKYKPEDGLVEGNYCG